MMVCWFTASAFWVENLDIRNIGDAGDGGEQTLAALGGGETMIEEHTILTQFIEIRRTVEFVAAPYTALVHAEAFAKNEHNIKMLLSSPRLLGMIFRS